MKQWLGLILLLFVPVLALAASENAQQVDQQEVERVLKQYLKQQSQRLPQVDLRFKSISLAQSFKVPAGRLEHQVIPAKPGVIGSRRVTLISRVDGRTVSNQSVRVELEALAEVAVATAALRRGTLLDADDVSLRYQDISRLDKPIFAIDEIVGKRLKRSVRLGEPLQRHRVEFPPVVKRGDRVVIQAQSAGLLLTAAGEARQDGRSGETIQVRNSSSQKTILCRVVAPGQVKVEL
jgi:flagella basal body P-ring formation protein FlgA